MLGLMMFFLIQYKSLNTEQYNEKHYSFKHRNTLPYQSWLFPSQISQVISLDYIRLFSCGPTRTSTTHHQLTTCKTPNALWVTISYMKSHFKHKNIIIPTWHIISFRAHTFISLGVLDISCLLAQYRIQVVAWHSPGSIAYLQGIST